MRRIALTLVTMTLIASNLVVWLAPTPALAAVTTQVAAVTTPLPNSAPGGTATSVTASCPSGTVMVGGGAYMRRINDNTTVPGNGLKMNGTMPSDASGNPVADGATDPSSWTDVAGFGGQSDNGDEAIAFAMCSTSSSGGPTSTVVKTATVTGVATENNPPLKATATCPSGTRLVGGGALGTPPSEPSFKPIASYPSDSTGNASANGATNPDSWTSYGSTGQPNTTQQTTAFAVCSTDPSLTVQVARSDAAGPQVGTTFTATTVSCPAGTSLLDGGLLVEKAPGQQPQQGVHARGTFPSDASGVPVSNGASNPNFWTNVVQAGGQSTPGTNVSNFALCAQAPPPAQADLSITKTDSPDPVTTGGTLTYTLNVTNNGPQAATGVVATDTLPTGVTFVSASSGCTNASGTVTCTIGNLAASGAGASASPTITVTAPSSAGSITNTASVTGTETDPTPGNNSASADTTVQAPTPKQADLSLTKSDSPDPVTTGGMLTYTLTVGNAGPDAASNVVVTDTLPAGVTFVSATPSQGTCSGTTTVTCNLGTIASGGSATITIVVKAPSTAGVITNTASVKGSEEDPNGQNNSAGADTTVNPATGNGPDLSITKKDSPDPVIAGSQVTYTISVKNNGPGTATGVVVTDTLPAGVTFVSASSGCVNASGTVTCTIGTMANGATVTRTIKVTATAGGTISNTATVSGSQTDPKPANNSATATTKVIGKADVSIKKTAQPTTVKVGQNITYTLTVKNAGPSAATNVMVADTLPIGNVSYISATPSQGSCSVSGPIVTCNLGTIASGGTATITIVVKATKQGTALNAAAVKAAELDTSLSNNLSIATVRVTK